MVKHKGRDVGRTKKSGNRSWAETWGENWGGRCPQIWGGGRPMHPSPQYFKK